MKVLSSLDEDTDGMLLLIDEANKAPVEAELGLMCKLFTEELTRKGCERLCIGLAGLPNTIGILRQSHESSPRIFRTMTLAPLERAERGKVLDAGIDEAVRKNGFKISITPEATDMICTLCEGYPHFLQEFAYCAFEQDTDNVIDRMDVAESLFRENGAFDQLGRKYFEQSYRAFASDDYRTVLDAMAEHSADWISRADILKESGIKGTTIDSALRALKSKDAIVGHDTKPGLYRLPTVSFAVWVKAQKTARSMAPAQEQAEPTFFGSDS